MSSSSRTAPRAGKRNTDRASRRIAVKYGEARPDRSGYANNVSADGLYLQGTRFKPGTLLFIEAQVKGESFMLMAQVRWTTQAHPVLLMSATDRGVGVRILNPSPEWERAVTAVRSAAA